MVKYNYFYKNFQLNAIKTQFSKMFCLFSVFSASKEYTGDQKSSIIYAMDGDITFKSCRFIGLGTDNSDSCVFLKQGTGNTNLLLSNSVFSGCKANIGGAFSLDGNFNSKIEFLCTYNCNSSDKAGLWWIKLAKSPSISYVSSVLSNCLVSTAYFQNNGPQINNWNASNLKSTYRTISYWSYGNAYFNCNTETKVSYTNFVNCFSPCATIYNWKSTAPSYFEKINFHKNEVKDYALFYCEDCGSSAFTSISDAVFMHNILNSQAYFDGDNSLIILEKDVYVDNSYFKGTVERKLTYLSKDYPVPAYVFYSTELCFAENPYQEIIPTPNPPKPTEDNQTQETQTNIEITDSEIDNNPQISETNENTQNEENADESQITYSTNTNINTEYTQNSEDSNSDIEKSSKTEQSIIIINSDTSTKKDHAEDGTPKPKSDIKDKKNYWIYVIIGGAGLLVVITAIIAYKLLKPKEESTSIDDAQEFPEETVIAGMNDIAATIEYTNPLFTTSVMEEDPFCNDFDEAENPIDIFARAL